MIDIYHKLNKKLKLIKRLEQAKPAAHNDFKRLQEKDSDKKLIKHNKLKLQTITMRRTFHLGSRWIIFIIFVNNIFSK